MLKTAARSSHLQEFYKMAALIGFVKFARKNLRSKVACLGLELHQKRLHHIYFLLNWGVFSEKLFHRTPPPDCFCKATWDLSFRQMPNCEQKYYGKMWCVARFGTICTILKRWKTPIEECFTFFKLYKWYQIAQPITNVMCCSVFV